MSLHNYTTFEIVFSKQSKINREGELRSGHIITKAVADKKQARKHFIRNLEESQVPSSHYIQVMLGHLCNVN